CESICRSCLGCSTRGRALRCKREPPTPPCEAPAPGPNGRFRAFKADSSGRRNRAEEGSIYPPKDGPDLLQLLIAGREELWPPRGRDSADRHFEAALAPSPGGLYWQAIGSCCRPLGARMPGIFINYRRDDAPGVAGRLYDHLARKFTGGKLFIDVDAIKPGLDFVKQLDTQVSQCDALLAVIGPHWLAAADSKGKRRLDDPHDYVRIEIASALKRDIPVIPVLIDDAEMPAEADLPEDLAPLARRHALELRHTRFASDADAIVSALHTVLPETTKKNRKAIPLIAAGVVALVLIGGAIWWLTRTSPGT